MIECSSENIYYKKKRKFRLRFPFFILLIILLIFSYYRFFVTRKLVEICKEYSYSVCAESVNNAVVLSMSKDVNYSGLVNVQKNSNGDINLISLNTINANVFARDMVNNSKVLIKEKLSNGVPLPWLAFLGFDFLSGYGKEFNFKYLAISSVNCEFKGKFTSVGINQTLHSVYLKVVCSVAVNVPMAHNETIFESEVLVCENVLVGKVPEVYFGSK